MADILEKIARTTRENLEQRRRKVARSDFQSFDGYELKRRSMVDALSSINTVSVIAEIKKASPSKGVIRPDFDPEILAHQYTYGGASAISVLTDEPYFGGHLEYLRSARKHTDLPLLRKDFLVDPYQIEEARAYGADAVLLIATILEGSHLQEMQHAAREAGLEALVECYNEEETRRIDYDLLDMVGINNRDLTDFTVDLHRGVEILRSLDTDAVRISESGLSKAKDLVYLHERGIQTALIGEHFMRQSNPGDAVKELISEYKAQIDPEGVEN